MIAPLRRLGWRLSRFLTTVVSEVLCEAEPGSSNAKCFRTQMSAHPSVVDSVTEVLYEQGFRILLFFF